MNNITTSAQVFPGQYRWDPLEFEDAGIPADECRARALASRARVIKMIRKSRPDLECRVWALTGQLRKYRSMGVEDGRIRNVYYLNVSLKGQM